LLAASRRIVEGEIMRENEVVWLTKRAGLFAQAIGSSGQRWSQFL
jgi:hypothetical protein